MEVQLVTHWQKANITEATSRLSAGPGGGGAKVKTFEQVSGLGLGGDNPVNRHTDSHY